MIENPRGPRSPFALGWLGASLLILLTACRAEPPPSVPAEGPVVALAHEGLATHLVEAPRLAAPPETEPNRLTTGWRPTRGGLEPVSSRSGLEIVNLAARERTLHLRFGDLPEKAGPLVVYAGDIRLVEQALAPQMSIPLPAGAAPLSHFLDLVFPPSFAGRLEAVEMSPVLPAGRAEVDGDSILQTPSSCLDILHRHVDGGRVELGFEPPPALAPGQGFEAWLEDSSRGRRLLARFDETTENTPRALTADVGPGVFRLSLLATGDGGAGRWIEPSFYPSAAQATKPSPEPEPALLESQEKPPRLVLVYVLDALRADALDALADRGKIPFMTRLGQEGLTFASHSSVAPNTLPATASLFYGRLFERVLEPKDVDVTHEPSLAELFRWGGYRTALFSSNVYVTREFYMDRGFDYVAPRIDSAVVGENLASEQVTAAALEWLAQQSDEQPLFLYLHVINPHNPYTPPGAYISERTPHFGGDTPTLVEIREGRLRPTPRQTEILRRAYLDSVDYADAVLEGFARQLEDRFGRDDLALLVTSDHGEELLEHGGILHGHSLYEEALRIPLVAWPPERFGRGRIERQTTTLDLHRLLAALARSDTSSATRVPESAASLGVENLTVASASGVPRGLLSVSDGRWKVVLTGTRLEEWGMGYGPARTWDSEYLFHLVTDPGETRNHLGRGDLEARWLRAFARRLAIYQGSGGPVFTDFDEETAEKLKSLGYL